MLLVMAAVECRVIWIGLSVNSEVGAALRLTNAAGLQIRALAIFAILALQASIIAPWFISPHLARNDGVRRTVLLLVVGAGLSVLVRRLWAARMESGNVTPRTVAFLTGNCLPRFRKRRPPQDAPLLASGFYMNPRRAIGQASAPIGTVGAIHFVNAQKKIRIPNTTRQERFVPLSNAQIIALSKRPEIPGGLKVSWFEQAALMELRRKKLDEAAQLLLAGIRIDLRKAGNWDAGMPDISAVEPTTIGMAKGGEGAIAGKVVSRADKESFLAPAPRMVAVDPSVYPDRRELLLGVLSQSPPRPKKCVAPNPGSRTFAISISPAEGLEDGVVGRPATVRLDPMPNKRIWPETGIRRNEVGKIGHNLRLYDLLAKLSVTSNRPVFLDDLVAEIERHRPIPRRLEERIEKWRDPSSEWRHHLLKPSKNLKA
jgi:hypothetical protein